MTTHEKMLQSVYAARGQMLQFAIEIESLMDVYISKHFTTDTVKQMEFITFVIAPRVTLMEKLKIFQQLVDKYNPDFRKAVPLYAKDLQEIIEQRNIFAHYPIDFSDESIQAYKLNGTLTFVKLKHTKDYGMAAKAEINNEYLASLFDSMKVHAQNIHRLNTRLVTTLPPA